jgi:hypothetical protein
MTFTTRAAEAAEQRAEAVRSLSDRPQKRRSCEDDGIFVGVRSAMHVGAGLAEYRAKGKATAPGVIGHASVTEAPYEMYDMFGPYSEVVSRGAFAETLSTSPLVEFTVNHGAGGGIPMAHTRNATLTLSEDETGLHYEASVDPSRTDVADMLKAIERGDLAEASFKFRITSGQWSPDYTEYRINVVDLAGGDVSAVNFGANPAATSALRSAAAQVRLMPWPDETQHRAPRR